MRKVKDIIYNHPVFEHAAVWIFYLLFLFLTLRLEVHPFTFPIFLSAFLPVVFVFYSSLLLIHRFLPRKQYGLLFFLLLLSNFAVLATGMHFNWLYFKGPPLFLFTQKSIFPEYSTLHLGMWQVFRFTLLAFLYSVFSQQNLQLKNSVKVNDQAYRNKILAIDTHSKLIKVEKKLLNKHLHPHTLHNILNRLYAKALPISESLAEDLLKLNDFLVYSLNPQVDALKLVHIDKEIQHIHTLIRLHESDPKLRSLTFKIHGAAESQSVPELGLLTLVENALKYGIKNNPGKPIDLVLELKPNHVFFRISNYISPSASLKPSFGTGLRNLKRRLELSFPDAHELMHGQVEDRFYACLRIGHVDSENFL